ncbi:MAG: alkaline phosphatase D family protein [Myxococcus sp.]|nr:alkaline phosphatase D family protein [Myxococcus sp.]
MTTRRQFLRVVAVGGAWAGCGQVPGVMNVMMEPGLDGGTLELDAGALDAGAMRGVDAGVDAGLPVENPEPWATSTQFGFGISSGDATFERVLVSTRYDGANPLRLKVWRMEQDAFAQLAADVPVMPGDGGFVQLDVQQLTPGAHYRYAFVEETSAGPLRSVLGRFRAALPAGASEPLVFGACSCTASGAAAPLLHAGGRTDLAAFFLLGDTSYNDGADTLSEYRARWHQSLSREAYRALRASTSVIATWDDHEVTNNFNPETISVAKLNAARQAFFEALPIRRHEMAPNRLWRSFRYGDAVEVFVLDTRGERKPSTLLNGNHEMISLAQQTWLQGALKASPSRIKLVMNSVPISDFGFSAFNTDAWRAYQRQRLEVLRFVEDENLTGVLWVSGDHHFASVGTVSMSGVGARAVEVLAGPGAQSANPLFRLLTKPRWDYASGDNNYVALHCQPATGEVRVVFHDGAGAVLFEKTYLV